MKNLLIIFIAMAFLSTKVTANETIKKLNERMKSANSLVCVGLDPDLSKIPLSILEQENSIEENVFDFLKQVVDITAEHVCCYKAQKAFFDQYEQGHLLFNRIVAYIKDNHSNIPVFIDCKIGDIDNTMTAYMHRLFDEAHVDGVVVNPYMGDDVFEPFLQDPKKVALVMVQTSNANADVVQKIKLQNGKKLWEEILDLTLDRWNKHGNLIVILSSNSMENYEKIRGKIPEETPILLAGIGSQGGNPEIMKQLLNTSKSGVFVNSSRGILYPYDPSNKKWQKEVLNAVIKLKKDLNKISEG